MRVRFYNKIWDYTVTVDDGIVTEASYFPCGRVHWAVGNTLYWLMTYYDVEDLHRPLNPELLQAHEWVRVHMIKFD